MSGQEGMRPLAGLIVISWYAAVSVVAFWALARDKRAAVQSRRRVPERTLHLLELFGGVPGAVLGICVLRHKNRKASFLFVTIAVAALHLAIWVAIGQLYGLGWLW